jgi:demethylmenaquinone methyltransferase/2-methoxy-6-polyprenyl-1,4-benzoquinol methylase
MEIKLSRNSSKISRVTRSHAEAKKSYNRLCKWYDLLSSRSEKKFINYGLEKLNIKEGEKILEIGFGTGYSILKMAKSVGDLGKVYGIDISEGMVEETLSKIKDEGMTKRVSLICEDAIKLSYESNFFNAIFMSFTLELFDTPELPILLNECKRVLQKYGRICVVSLSKVGKPGFLIRFYEYIHEKFPKYVDCRPIYCKEIIENQGFGIVDELVKPMMGLPIEIVLAKKLN